MNTLLFKHCSALWQNHWEGWLLAGIATRTAIWVGTNGSPTSPPFLWQRGNRDSTGDQSTPWEADVAVEGYFDKDLKVMPLTTAQMRTTAVSACASYWKSSQQQAL